MHSHEAENTSFKGLIKIKDSAVYLSVLRRHLSLSIIMALWCGAPKDRGKEKNEDHNQARARAAWACMRNDGIAQGERVLAGFWERTPMSELLNA